MPSKNRILQKIVRKKLRGQGGPKFTMPTKDTQVSQDNYMAQQKAKQGSIWLQPDSNPTKIPTQKGLNMGVLGQRPQVNLGDDTVPPSQVSKPMGKNRLRYQLFKS